MVNYIILIGIMFLFAIFTGIIIPVNANKSHFVKLCYTFMKYFELDFEAIQTILLGSLYVLMFMLGMIVLAIYTKFNILAYFPIHMDKFQYIIWGIVAEMSVSGLVVGIAFMFMSNKKWSNQMNSISWIKSMDTLPQFISWLIPVVGAFFEELFFRGFVFIILVTRFPEYGVIIPIVVSAVLFAVQQALNTQTLLQALSMSVGAISVAVIGCLLILITNSFLPSLLAHESFVVFYFKQMDSTKKMGNRFTR